VVVGWQDLKRENKCGVDIMPPVIEEPPMLRTMLFQGGRMMRIMRAAMYLLVFP
jgi:hypothetical protein